MQKQKKGAPIDGEPVHDTVVVWLAIPVWVPKVSGSAKDERGKPTLE